MAYILIALMILIFLGFIICGACYIIYKIGGAIIKTIRDILFDPNPLKNDSKNENWVVMTFVAMAKLTPDYHIDENLTAQIRDRVKFAFWDIDCFANLRSLMEAFDRFSCQGNTIKVSQLQDELKVFEKKSFHFKKNFMIGLLSVAYINGNLDENQEKLLNMVKNSIRMSDSTYSTVMSIFWKKMKSGEFMNYEEFKKRQTEWKERDAKNKGRERSRNWYNQSDYSNNNNQEERREYNQSSYAYVPTELEKAYSVLGLSLDASVEDIKKMKRELLKKYHPDLYTGKGNRAVEKATLKSQEINQAYEMIMKMKN